MDSRFPLAAALAALLWVAAAATGSRLLLVAVAVAALLGPALPALGRRPPTRRAALAAGLGVLAASLAGVLAALLWLEPRGARSLLLMAGFVVVAGTVAPLLYAATFRKEDLA